MARSFVPTRVFIPRNWSKDGGRRFIERKATYLLIEILRPLKSCVCLHSQLPIWRTPACGEPAAEVFSNRDDSSHDWRLTRQALEVIEVSWVLLLRKSSNACVEDVEPHLSACRFASSRWRCRSDSISMKCSFNASSSPSNAFTASSQSCAVE